MIEHLRVDVVTALRAFRSAPGPAAAMILTLAVAVGANLAMFGLIDRALLSPPAHVIDPATRVHARIRARRPGRAARPDVDHLLRGLRRDPRRRAGRVRLRRHGRGSRPAAWSMASRSRPRRCSSRARTSRCSAPGRRLGRTILPDDDRAPAGAPVAVLSHAFWRRAFAGDAGASGPAHHAQGQRLRRRRGDAGGVQRPLGDARRPVGAAARRHGSGARLGSQPVSQRGGGRPAPARRPDRRRCRGASRGRGRCARRAHADQRRPRHAGGAHHRLLAGGGLGPGARDWPGEHGDAAAGPRRAPGRELGIRAALGASSGRLLSQLVVESAVLAAIAVAAALLARVLDRRRRPPAAAAVADRDAAASTARTARRRGVRGPLHRCRGRRRRRRCRLRALRRAGQSAAASRQGRPSVALLLLQTTLAVLLLAGAGMFGRSLYTLAGAGLRHADGRRARSWTSNRDRASQRGQDQLFDVRARARPRAARRRAWPRRRRRCPSRASTCRRSACPAGPRPPTIDGQLPFLIAATPELFDILGSRRRAKDAGLTAADESGAPVALVNETMARTVWPGESALGQCFRIGFDPAFDPETAAGPPAPSPSAALPPGRRRRARRAPAIAAADAAARRG